MTLTSEFSSEDIRTIQGALLRDKFAHLPPIGRTLALYKDPQGHCDALGPKWHAFKGLDRLIAVSLSGSAMQPLDALETLIASANEPALFNDVRRLYLPNVSGDYWSVMDAFGGLHRSALVRDFSFEQQLALYQWAAWSLRLGSSPGRDHDAGADIKVWDNAPTFVRTDALMQQIIALKSPVLLQECIARSLNDFWDPYAVALCLQRTGLSKQLPWYTIVDNEMFGQLVSPHVEHPLILGRSDAHLYQFPEDKLPTLQAINPALFIHGVLHNHALRKTSAKKWFVPMLESAFTKTLNNASYVNYLLSPLEESTALAQRFDSMFAMFAPDYTRLLPIYQSLHSGDTAYREWARGCARSIIEQSDRVALPDLNEPALQ